MKMVNGLKVVLPAVMLLAFAGVGSAAVKKVLYVGAYHVGYVWEDGITEAVTNSLGDKTKYDLEIIHMDTKRNPGEEFKKQAAEKVRDRILAWKPDAVITSDDNTSKYVIVPYFKNSDVPFATCGINWDASIYGFPCKNVTGMLEVAVTTPLLDMMRKYAKGDRMGFIGADNETDHKEDVNLNKRFNLKMNSKFVKTFDEWKAAYLELQNQVDMLIVINIAGIKGWNDEEAKAFVRENTKIPSGSNFTWTAPFVLVDYAKIAQEQGEWAAGAAIQIMNGKSPADIPWTENKKGQFYLNLPLAKKLGITFPLEALKAAKVVSE